MAKRKNLAHPLFSREIRPIRNWHEWLTRWEAAQTFDEIQGLLHTGFNVQLEKNEWGEKEYRDVDRYLFYLAVADGWRDPYQLDLPEDRGKGYPFGTDALGRQVRKSPSELRGLLAKKAFDMLATNLFKLPLDEDGRRDGTFDRRWESVITSAKLFPALQGFFKPEAVGVCGRGMRIRNLSTGNRSHNGEQSVLFLLNLFKFIWGWKKKETWSTSEAAAVDMHNAEVRSRLDPAKLWMIEILSVLGQLDLLWKIERDEPLDEACVAKLEEIALRNELLSYQHPVKEDRPVASLDEACFAGSATAYFLKKLEIVRAERKRLERIRNAEKKREEAERTIRELAPKERGN